jgi:hypothetical protein
LVQSQAFVPGFIANDFFNGSNSTNLESDPSNKTVGVSVDRTMSDYVYLSAKLSEKQFGVSHLKFKWFFDIEAPEPDTVNIPTKTCNYFEESYSSKSSESSISSLSSTSLSSSSDFVCRAGTTYNNDAVDPISFVGTVYSWPGGYHDFSTQGHADISLQCRRVLIYDNVYHDGSKYILNQPSILAPRSSGQTVPSIHPYKTPCWNFSRYYGDGTIEYKLGGNKSFNINTTRLYQNLIVQNGLEIPSGRLHAVALVCDIYALHRRQPYQFLYYGNIVVNPMAYYHRP